MATSIFLNYVYVTGSLLKQKLNKIILELQDDGTIPALLTKWFPYSTTC